MSKCFFVNRSKPLVVNLYSGGDEFCHSAQIINKPWTKFISDKCKSVDKLHDYAESTALDENLEKFDGYVMPAFRGIPDLRMVVMSDEGFTAFLLEYA